MSFPRAERLLSFPSASLSKHMNAIAIIPRMKSEKTPGGASKGKRAAKTGDICTPHYPLIQDGA